MFGIPDAQWQHLRASMRRQQGAVKLFCSRQAIHGLPAGVKLFQTTSGAHAFRIISEDQRKLSFYHSSPGTGTRVATVDLSTMAPTNRLTLYFDWSPSAANFGVGSPDNATNFVQAVAVPSTQTRLYALTNGDLMTIGAGATSIAYQEGDSVSFETPGIESWNETRTAIDVMLTGQSQANTFQMVVCNVALVMLVTGLEVYMKSRFSELEAEGVAPNEERLARVALDAATKQAGGIEVLRTESKQTGMPVFPLLKERIRFLFQDFDRAKEFYNKAYNIRFGMIASSQTLSRIRRLIKYRHRIVHVSPSIDMLNWPWLPKGEQPEFANRKLAETAVTLMDDFVKQLHAASLRADSFEVAISQRPE